MTPQQVEAVNAANEILLIPMGIIPVITKRTASKLHYKDTISQTRYAVKIDNNQFNVREYLPRYKKFGSRTIFRTNNSEKELVNNLSDFKHYVLKNRAQYIKMMNKNFGALVALKNI